MISVCLATYNGEKYIEEQIDSILGQISEEDEIIISDDGSSDATLEKIRTYKDIRIKILHNKERKGVIGNFENALNNAKGEYIFLCDQDDIWLSHKVRMMLSQLNYNDLVFSNANIVDDGLNVLGLLYINKNNCGFINNLLKNRFIGATMAFRSSLLKKALPFPNYIPMHDQWLGLLAEIYGKVYYFEEPLILYRRHSSNSSSTGKKSKYNLFEQLRFRLNICKAIINRYFFQ